MGLDMYLKRKKYIGANHDFNNITGKIELYKKDKLIPIDFNKVSYIEEDVMYWRKANQIHKYFVELNKGVDDCNPIYVELKDLEKLLEKCKKVRDKAILMPGKVKNGETFENGKIKPILETGVIIENADEIAEILPTKDGFFFGSTEYDQYYMQDINNTIPALEQIIEEEKELNKQGFFSEFYYIASW